MQPLHKSLDLPLPVAEVAPRLMTREYFARKHDLMGHTIENITLDERGEGELVVTVRRRIDARSKVPGPMQRFVPDPLMATYTYQWKQLGEHVTGSLTLVYDGFDAHLAIESALANTDTGSRLSVDARMVGKLPWFARPAAGFIQSVAQERLDEDLAATEQYVRELG